MSINYLSCRILNCRIFNICLVGLIVLTCNVVYSTNANAADKNNEKIPVKRIVLFNSGVGYFEHLGSVEGDDEIDLHFKTSDINDLLKSLVLQDLGGGKISSVSYDSRDPIAKTLKTFAIDLTANPTISQLLDQIRGHELIVQAPNEIRGTIIGVETRQIPVQGGEPFRNEYVKLLTEDGMQCLAISEINSMKIADPELQKEFRAALQTLASNNATDKKTVTLKFLGEGQRPVRIGYIHETPVWKTSYRLVLDDKQAPFLQGWAIVENTSDQDWENIQLSLVSGRPISFKMDLYSPLYAPRPQVAHQLYAALQPQDYDQSMIAGEMSELESLVAENAPASVPKLKKARSSRRAGGGGFGGGGGRGRSFGGVETTDGPYSGPYSYDLSQEMDLSESISAVAQAADVGELFRYDIDMPVSIQRQRSAMLPIINHVVEAAKLSIYNRNVHAKHPLNGIRLKNTSDLHLMPGPITLFDGGMYAGDGKIGSLPPGVERLISYAMDLNVEVVPSYEAATNKLVTVKIINGSLHTTHQHFRTQKYVVKNSDDQKRTVLIEQPLDSGWKLVDEKQANEITRDRYRFEVEVEPSKTTTLLVKEQRQAKQTFHAGNINHSQFRFYLSADEVSDSIKTALKEIQKRQQELAELKQRRSKMRNTLSVIENEQKRIRQNMQQLPRDSQLYKRYVNKFSTQEDNVEEIRDSLRKLQEEESAKQASLNEFVAKLNME